VEQSWAVKLNSPSLVVAEVVMCAVFLPTHNVSWVRQQFGVELPVTAVAADVYPAQLAPVVVKSHRDDRTAIGQARFGVIPSWAKDDKISRHTYNARAETVTEKPSYRSAWKNRRYAIALADAFYEPCYEIGRAIRWRIARADHEPMGIASIWDRWTDPATGEVIASFSMLTINADAHPVMRRFHKPNDEKRTPVVLPADRFDDWLSATPEMAMDLLRIELMPELTAEPA
jgi:putative SOS response-associated peptidase YedK